ncbi:hypothetical protein CLF_111535 [Clonorchis sinensis]|uniref:Uncharacterized protein n=1 Tax=Clonorchis sinensis TaxID=79923 RepID=G7YLQ9_CLOSI|nr:hypothetical protein CLF_111535 [Clonorchis sinensis]
MENSQETVIRLGFDGPLMQAATLSEEDWTTPLVKNVYEGRSQPGESVSQSFVNMKTEVRELFFQSQKQLSICGENPNKRQLLQLVSIDTHTHNTPKKLLAF